MLIWYAEGTVATVLSLFLVPLLERKCLDKVQMHRSLFGHTFALVAISRVRLQFEIRVDSVVVVKDAIRHECRELGLWKEHEIACNSRH